ncbi:MAG: efflux RND transporter periplasmic adaptor subunit [Candidatus Omnitrophica bacterium]|nr:efflux RND transporter periplasmic adaptor subunit [Candidatus Omnitrophota bacterium]MBU1868912.1 efflux RND transporter periplasmic adaptor subunit [Candidatus Omnitrophota bacterium]
MKVTSSIFLIAAVLSMIGCQQKPQENSSNNQAIPVKAAKIQLEDIDEALDYVGDIKAQDEATVYPKVSGKIIEKIREDGAIVKKGEPILYIDRDEVGLKFEKAPVESPISGVVGRINVDIGQNVNPETIVALVVNMDKVKINLDIPEKYLPQVTLGQEAKVKVDAYPDEVFSGKVTKISPVVDLATRTAPIEITIDNPGHLLKSGMYSKVSLVIQTRKDVPVVLKEALMGKEPDLYVYVVENNKAVLKKVAVGIRQGPYYEIKDGLKEGDVVVIMGQQRLFEGAKVAAEENNK